MEKVEVKYIFDDSNKSFNDCVIDIFKSYLILNRFDGFDNKEKNVIHYNCDVHDHI